MEQAEKRRWQGWGVGSRPPGQCFSFLCYPQLSNISGKIKASDVSTDLLRDGDRGTYILVLSLFLSHPNLTRTGPARLRCSGFFSQRSQSEDAPTLFSFVDITLKLPVRLRFFQDSPLNYTNSLCSVSHGGNSVVEP